MVTYNVDDRFMNEIVFETIENELYYLEGRYLSRNEKRLIVDIYNELEISDCPSISDLKQVWDIFYERISH